MTKPNKLSDSEIIAGIKGDTLTNNKMLQYIYSELDWCGKLINYIRARGCGAEDAEEIANSTLFGLSQAIRFNRFLGNSALESYFFKIGINQYNSFCRKKRIHLMDIDNIQVSLNSDSIEIPIISEERIEYIEKIIGQLGDKCKEIFRLLGIELGRDEMAKQLKYKNENIVKKAVYRCRKKFLEYIDANPNWKHFLK